ncbi:hypothetical protein CDAR_615461 [Caerostris darwini]|uniref:Uncharacterized protein n=1 Tax=Caerostris darwini TaxID=1538125 RepID=A0AAV4RU92_9ARAC|nr:hypothetical protein CDAR_615461 [Caerostris darwini]
MKPDPVSGHSTGAYNRDGIARRARFYQSSGPGKRQKEFFKLREEGVLWNSGFDSWAGSSFGWGSDNFPCLLDYGKHKN